MNCELSIADSPRHIAASLAKTSSDLLRSTEIRLLIPDGEPRWRFSRNELSGKPAATPAARSWESTTVLARSCVCPSPWSAVYDLARQSRCPFTHFHHGLLRQRGYTAPNLAVIPFHMCT